MKPALSAIRSWPGRFIRFYWGEGIADDVPALTYYLVLSLAPFILGLVAVSAIVFGDQLSPDKVADTVARALPPNIQEEVDDLVSGTRRNSPLLLGLAIVAMLWTSSGAIGVVERCLARTIPRPRHSIVVGRMRNLALGAMVATLLIAAVAGVSLLSGLALQVGITWYPPAAVTTLGHFLGTVLMCCLIYRWAVIGHVSWVSALRGAVPAAVVVQAAPVLVGSYFSSVTGFSTGQLFAGIAVGLVGCNLLANGLLIGAGLVAKSERERNGSSQAL